MAFREIVRRFSTALLFLAAFTGLAPLAEAWSYQQAISTFFSYNPNVHLVKGSDGNLYGTTATGGLYGVGQIVLITTDGETSTLASFDWTNGGTPMAALIEGSDGNYYGTTSAGGANGFGTFFSVTTGGTLTVLASFDGANGATVVSPLVETAPGVFYGISYCGGATGTGAVFKATVSQGAATLSAVASFKSADGEYPNALVYSGGVFYGTTVEGGATGGGTVFRLKFTNSTATKGSIETLVALAHDNGYFPVTLIAGQDGNLYGLSGSAQPAAQKNGISAGSIFKVTPAGKITVVAYFDFNTTGSSPNSLVQGADGNFYGATTFGGDVDPDDSDLGVLFKCVVTGETGTIQALSGWPATTFSNGATGLIFDSATQFFYGADARIPTGESENNPGYSEVFSYGSSAGYSALATIPNPTTPPTGGMMIEGGDGNLYGITPTSGPSGNGTVFKILPGGAYLTLVNFDGTNGASPSSLLLGMDGAIYGLTSGGGSGNGTMFRINSDGTLDTLATFDGTTTGASPSALLETRAGMFLGAASIGGASGDGTLFQAAVTGNTANITPILSFGGSNGSAPNSLMEARDGSFYGTTSGGGGGSGTIFQLGATMEASSFQSLVSFTGATGSAPGATPTGAPVEAADGLFYGATLAGGNNSLGTVYQLTSAGANSTLASLLSFDPSHLPAMGNLIAGGDGTLYGADQTNGLYNVAVSGSTGVLTDLTPHFSNAFAYHNGPSAFSFLLGSDGFYYFLGTEGVTAALGRVSNGIPLTSKKSAVLQGSLTSLLPSRPGSFSVSQTTRGSHGTLTLPQGKQAFVLEEGFDNINRPNNVPLKVQYNFDNEGTFLVIVQDVLTRYQGVAREREPFTGKAPAPQAGRYTILLTPSDPSGNPLPGVTSGFGIMDVTAAGAVTLSGKLSDGTPVSASTTLALDQTATFFDPLDKHLGGLAGTVEFAAVPNVSDCDGVLQWVRPAQTGKTPVAALATNVQFLGSKFNRATLQTSGTVTLTENNETTFTHSLTISPTNGKVTITDPAADKTELTLDLTTGAFKGTFVDPGSGKKGTFGGVIYEEDMGAGELELNGGLGVVALTLR